ncbi:DUF2017 family protein [Jatrophihabitans sp.]|uniref:DUF2017 family protein n=1 Tax=Jatrophihabitans sp. TaxID=1932789 RepID=UPI002BD78D4A|nr:DUF2017 family protein [Jatrophihabitans sp.]
MKARRKAGLLRVDLSSAEAALLAGLLDELTAALTEPDPADPVIRRLYPDGYTDDPDAAREYRELVEADLRAERAGRLERCRTELPPGGGRMQLDAEATDRWLRVLNDLRLALGTRLGVTEEAELDEEHPAVQVYAWLTAVQDLLVTQVLP